MGWGRGYDTAYFRVWQTNVNPSLMVYFRRRLSPDILGEISEIIIRDANERQEKEDGNNPDSGKPRKFNYKSNLVCFFCRKQRQFGTKGSIPDRYTLVFHRASEISSTFRTKTPDRSISNSASSMLLSRRQYRSIITVSKEIPLSFDALRVTSPEMISL